MAPKAPLSLKSSPSKPPSSSPIDTFFSSTPPLILSSLLLRLIFLLYGLYQDSISAIKFTDIDYLVFTDASRSLSQGHSPYARETYRYTPLLAWLLYPTSFTSSTSSAMNTFWFSFGKLLFSLADVLAGHFLLVILTNHMSIPAPRARKFASIWLLNPMVATISARGSSEGLLGLLTAALLWAVLERKISLAGALLGLGVHFKIYPFVYAAAIVWWMDGERLGRPVTNKDVAVMCKIKTFFSTERIILAASSLAVFSGLNVWMYMIYGHPFLLHTYLHHVTRIDHRHNFSPYNILLYLVSADPSFSSSSPLLRIESVAFLPQVLLATILIPLACAKKDLPTTMLAQTLTFVTFNKVCTSQYFLWYLIFLPLYLPNSSLLRQPKLGVSALVLWIGAQAAWLQQGYQLEFLGQSTFLPGMWMASLGFFLVNCWILGLVVGDAGASGVGK
ncbi:GPI mannosyltransferase 1 [Zalerion maritima]|uniref:GPI mannosyltransferase 1 n=1 Tax=Zalerion maritima TaxID=339359 RepID=A0AAD5WQ91_9PEZI|nr:GPI mannosyltransferase 1 [Zalerion maritima]